MIAPGTWAYVELMGHRQVVGTLSETEVAGVKLLAVAKPDGAVQLYSGAAIYAITPCTEEQARDRWPYMFGAAAELSPVTGFDAWVDDLDDPGIDDEIGDDE